MRIRVLDPPAGVAMQVQHGRDHLLPPMTRTSTELVFEFPASIDLAGAAPNFLGQYAHGPKDSRFVYLNSGTYAGQPHTCWSRRAKISLMNISSNQVDEALSAGKMLETSFPGRGRDGGPVCASVKGIEWKVVQK